MNLEQRQYTPLPTNMDKQIKLAIVGATGAVGSELLQVLEKRNFPAEELRLFASPRSLGKKISFRGSAIAVQELSEAAFQGINIAIFSAGRKVARQWAPIAIQQGAKVIDNSSAFRMDPNVPLIIPEINSQASSEDHFLISCPNCSAAIMLMAAAPLHRRFKIVRRLLADHLLKPPAERDFRR